MALTDCEKCWCTPCECGYKDGLNTLSHKQLIKMINSLIEECEFHWDMENITGNNELMELIKIYKEKGI